MVDKLKFHELLDIDDISERNIALRRAFTGYTVPMDVTGNEASALTILLNLTYPRKRVDDLLDKRLAKQTLNTDAHLDASIDEVQWLHTHNLKYPDIRVSKQRLITASPLSHSHILSSANCISTLGWSHDSAKVNLAKLFSCHFNWQDRVCCLATLLSDPPKIWKEAFQALGMLVKDFMNLCGRIKASLPSYESPSRVDKYSIQVRLPYRDGYLAITPVVSHALQAEIQQAAMAKQCRYTNFEFTRPAAVSELSASLGGNVKALNYPPRIGNAVHGLSDSWLLKFQAGQTVLNQGALSQPRFKRALEGLLSNGFELALKQRRLHKVASMRQIRATLTEWLSPLLEWRLEVEENKNNVSELACIHGSFEYQFLTAQKENLVGLLNPMFSLLNTILSNSNTLQKYAFHQRLMRPLKCSLKWLLDNLSKESNAIDSDEDNQQRYLYLKGIRVFDAQALSNPYCAGLPSLTAVWGMVHNYQRRLNKRLGTQLRLTSFSWFIRQYSSVAGKKLPEYGMQGQKENQFRRAGIVDNKHCDLVFDLVVHIDGYEEDLDAIDNSTDAIKASFPATFAGGVMHPPEIGSVDEWCELYPSETSLYSKLRRLPASGKWVMPTRYQMDSLDGLLQLLKLNVALCPVMSGYLMLGPPESRKNSLEPLHCYAEPAIGVVECATAIDIRLQGMSNFFRRAFWMLDIKETSMLMKRI
ncbi:type I-F CRISPR-associated protein Csy2 [Shewanella sp. UCD-KL21]|uniref:type I-F CRISPR-associated protein Csy2 n=1 Tax=Shewanella sp. UCD-KL21 TaxID=1917164 RepID=UPI000970F7B4|nr:type I-F CRISPR-associated protein Csy2 [Shewanella sp. UCD-KL21]USN27051.1 Cas8 [synthetic construct]